VVAAICIAAAVARDWVRGLVRGGGRKRERAHG
jgi:hypothetical protein